MAKTYEELLEQAAIIRDETAAGKNTATRVGGTITDAVDYVKELQDTYKGIHAEAAAAKDAAAAAKSTASEAKMNATAAMNTARSASLNATAANGTANAAKTESAQAVSTAQDAKEAADAAKTTAEQAKKSATNAFDSARSAVFTATAAGGTANAAKATADVIAATAQEAKEAAAAAQTAAHGAQTTAASLLQDIPWEGYHMNAFTETGEYHIHGESTDANDGLPILNSGTIDARLTVLDSSLTNGTGAKTDIVVTQILRLSNRTGGDGHVYVRTGQAASKDELKATDSTKWGTWEKLMGMFEKNAVTNIDDLNTYTTNGMYSGLFTNAESKSLGGLEFTPGDTFLIVTVNGYAASAFGTAQLTQMLYLLPTKNDNATAKMYLRTAYWNVNVTPKRWEFANWDRLAMANDLSPITSAATAALNYVYPKLYQLNEGAGALVFDGKYIGSASVLDGRKTVAEDGHTYKVVFARGEFLLQDISPGGVTVGLYQEWDKITGVRGSSEDYARRDCLYYVYTDGEERYYYYVDADGNISEQSGTYLLRKLIDKTKAEVSINTEKNAAQDKRLTNLLTRMNTQEEAVVALPFDGFTDKSADMFMLFSPKDTYSYQLLFSTTSNLFVLRVADNANQVTKYIGTYSSWNAVGGYQESSYYERKDTLYKYPDLSYGAYRYYYYGEDGSFFEAPVTKYLSRIIEKQGRKIDENTQNIKELQAQVAALQTRVTELEKK